MRRIYAVAGLAVMTVGVAGWAALAWAQPDLGDKLPPSDSQLIDPGPVAAPMDPSPLPPNPSAVPLPTPAKQPMKQAQTETPVELPPLPEAGPATSEKKTP